MNIKRPIHPNLNDLNEALRRSQELPVRLEAVPVIEIRLKAVSEWVNTLKNYFVKLESSNESSNNISQVSFVNSNKTIMELLTPRIDSISIVNKILNSHSSSSSMSNNIKILIIYYLNFNFKVYKR